MIFRFTAAKRNNSPDSLISGFTLVELLVGISIMLVLVSLLLVGVTKAIQASKQAQTVSNLKTLGMACLSYASDHNGFLPLYDPSGKKQTTIGPGLGSRAAPRKLFASKNYQVGEGDTDYLVSPDALYSPFAERLVRLRQRGTIYKDPSGNFLIGYDYFSLPRQNLYDPSKPLIIEGMANEHMTDSAKAPLFAEITTGNYQKEEISTPWLTYVCLDGSVHAIPISEIIKITNWKDRLKRMTN